jgi:tape measure domain-containing protein
MNGRLRDSKSRFEASSNSAKQASGSFGNLAGTLKKAAAAYVSLAAAQSAVRTGIQRIESERRIKFLAEGYGEVEQLSKAAADASVRFGQSQTTANKALAGVYARLRPVGVSLEEIVSTYNGFNTAARISGATAVEAENAFTQLAQALGSGALRGDEFNSISEQVPGILTAIAKETGVAQGQLRAYAADGMITADVVIAALQRIEKEGANQLAEALGGPEQSIREFQNASEDVQVALTEAIVPEMATAFQDLAAIIEGLEPSIRFIGGLIGDALGGARALIDSLRGGPVVERLRQGGGLGFNVAGESAELGAFFGKKRFAELKKQAKETAKVQGIAFADALAERLRVAIKVIDETAKVRQQQQIFKPTVTKPTGLVFGGGRNGRGGRGGRGGSVRSVAEQKDISQALYDLEVMRLEASKGTNRFKEIQLQGEIETLKVLERQLQPREEALRLAEIEQDTLLKAGDLLVPIYDGAKEIQDAASKFGTEIAEAFIKVDDAKIAERLKEQADRMNQIYSSIGQTIQSGIVDSLTAAVEGTKSLADVASDTLRSLASILLQFGVQTALAGLGGGNKNSIFTKLFGGGRASGGTVSAGTSYVVGERGPELFTPGRSGSIAPNNALGGSNIVVNVDASGTNAQGNGQNAKQLGAAIGAAVQAELIKQQRPGGLLAR